MVTNAPSPLPSSEWQSSSIFLVVPSGSVFRLCGRLLHMSFLDHKGVILPVPSEKWDTKSNPICLRRTKREHKSDAIYLEPKLNRSNDGFTPAQDLSSSTVLPGSSGPMSFSGPPLPPATMTTSNNVHYAVFCSSKQARVRRALHHTRGVIQ